MFLSYCLITFCVLCFSSDGEIYPVASSLVISRKGFEKGSSSLKKRTLIIINNNIIHACKYKIKKRNKFQGLLLIKKEEKSFFN